MNPVNPDHEQTYRRALELYRRGELNNAAELLERLEASGYTSVEIRNLMADLRLQQKLTAKGADFREEPVRRTTNWSQLALGGALLLVLLGAGVLLWLQPWQQRPALSAEVTPTPLPTATLPLLTATLPLPTATATPLPTATPLAANRPTGQIAVRLPTGQSSFVQGPRNIAIILDASGSMTAQVDGKPKMEIARSAVSRTIQGLPAETQLALRTYGNQRSGDCADLSLIRPLGVHDRATLIADLAKITPTDGGMTPIAASLNALRTDLATAKGYTAVLLVSDGVESCDGDPVLVAKALTTENPRLRIHVIGFDIGDAAATERLRAIAQIGGGSYFDARKPEDLGSALQEAVQRSYRVLSESGAALATGQVGGAPVALPPGHYHLFLDSDPPVTAQADVQASTVITFTLTADGSKLEPTPP